MVREINLTNPKIDKLIHRIEEGEIKIPPLQRGYVWKQDQILSLLESIYNDYPIGSILLWETNDRLPYARNIAGFTLPDKPETHPVYYVLDGQQRLSSLYGVFCKLDLQIEKKGYDINHDIFTISFDLKSKEFLPSNEKLNSGTYIDLRVLFDIVSFTNSIKHLPSDDQETASELLSTFQNYEVPIVTTKKRSLEEVGIIFERINNTGTKLELFDLMVAWTWTEDFHLKEKFDEILEILDRKNFDKIEKKVILQCLSSIIKESSRSKIILSLKPKEVRDNFDKLKTSLEKTIDYLSTELSVKTRETLPHSHQIVPLCYFFSLQNIPDAKQNDALKQWFWKTSFSARYSASTDTHIDEDIQAMKKLVLSKDINVFNKYTYSVTEEQLLNTQFRIGSAYTRAYILLLANNIPLNLIKGNRIDASHALSPFNRKEFHHVFPRNYLQKVNISKDKINCICNFCMLPSDSNKEISDNPPSKYFQLVPETKFKQIIESNLLPLKHSIYEKDDFNNFLEERARLIIRKIDELIHS